MIIQPEYGLLDYRHAQFVGIARNFQFYSSIKEFDGTQSSIEEVIGISLLVVELFRSDMIWLYL